MALGGAHLAQVVPQRPPMVGMELGQRFECTTRAYGVQLAVVAQGDELGAGGLDRGQQPAHVGVGDHAAFVDDHHVTGLSTSRLCVRRQVSDATVRDSIPAPSPKALAACPEMAMPITL